MNFAHNRIISPSEIDNSKYRCEYVVIGSGAGGSVAAMELSEAGKDVIILEEGLYFDSSDFKNDISDMTKASWRNSGVTPFWGKPPIGFAEPCKICAVVTPPDKLLKIDMSSGSITSSIDTSAEEF